MAAIHCAEPRRRIVSLANRMPLTTYYSYCNMQ
jgi:hypothetical protein